MKKPPFEAAFLLVDKAANGSLVSFRSEADYDLLPLVLLVSELLLALALAWAFLTSASALALAALASLSQAFFSSPFIGLHFSRAAL